MPKFSFEKYWQRLIKGMDETPPESVWDNIQDELDFDEVWAHIDQNIPAPTGYLQGGIKMFLKVAAIILLLFIPKNERISDSGDEILSFSNSSFSISSSNNTAKENHSAPYRMDAYSDNNDEASTPQEEIKSEDDARNYKQEKTTVFADVANDERPNDKEKSIKATTDKDSASNSPKNEKVIVQNKQIDQPEEDINNTLLSVLEESPTLVKSDSKKVKAVKSKSENQTSKPDEFKLSTINASLDSLQSDVIAELNSNANDEENYVTQKNGVPDEEEINELNSSQYVENSTVTILIHDKLDNIAPVFNFYQIKIADSIGRVAQADRAEYKTQPQPFLQLAGIGINGAIKNSRLMNNDTRVANSGNSLSSTSLTFAKDIGVSVQWQNRKNQILQASYLFISESAQTYNQYNEARYGQRRLKVNYQTLSVEFIQPIRFTDAYLVAGPYLSKIQSVEESFNDNLRDFTSDYQDWEYGINLGIQYKILIFNKISVQPSVKFQYGLNNIFRGNNLVPANFNNTNPMNISFGIGIYYQIKK